jgi:GxxExxY protein
MATPANNANIMPEIVYKNECKIIYGLLFKIQNDLETNFQEKHYQRAFEEHLNENKIPYEKEFPLEVNYHGNILGKFFVDFTVWNKIIIEFKTTNNITSDHLKQVLRYLQAANMKLGLIVNFRQRPLKPVRILNSKVSYSRDSQAKPLA